jgi:transketolase
VRNAFISELIALAATDPRVFLVVGDLGFSVVEPYVERFPDRFLNAGVAEQNMMGVSAGLASEGFHVFVYSIANFPTFRCAEQIRNDVDYHKLAVTVVSVGGGLSYGNLGYSHHAVQDYGLMRLFPNMVIAAPGDPVEVRGCMRYLVGTGVPSYLRLGKAGEPTFHTNLPELTPGKWVPIVHPAGATKTLLTTGATMAQAFAWLSEPEFAGWALHTMPLWGMGWKTVQAEQLEAWEKVITLEDHLADGGFGSWLRESLEGTPSIQMRVTVRALHSRVCGLVGGQATLNRLGGITSPAA